MKHLFQAILLSAFSLTQLTACAQDDERFKTTSTFKQMSNTKAAVASANKKRLDTATFAAGCFWCTEAQFQQLQGVEKVESGYEGGHVKNPSYREVCDGTTGHAEVCRITYDPAKISYDEMLAAFWTTHDPTQLNRQGNDVGTQYRSAIFYHNKEQQAKALAYKEKLNAEKAWDKPVVTEVSPASTFYKAEDYHQDYYNQNGNQPYCTFVVAPKLDKFKKVFAGKLKK